MPVKLLIVDEHEVIRAGVSTLLQDTDIEVVGEATSGGDAVKKTRRLRPDVVLLDVKVEDEDGKLTLETLRKKFPDTPVVVFSYFDNPSYVSRSALAGAADYVLKDGPLDYLVSSIKRAAAGEEAQEGSLMRDIQAVMAKRGDLLDGTPLTRRELQVLRHVGLGLSNRQIAQSLDITIDTVKEHVQNILRKMDMKDRTEAAVWAVRKKLV